MNTKIAKVMKGFLELTDTEKSELVDQINKYQRGNYKERSDLSESIRDLVKSSINFGPSPAGGCPCCGK